MNAAAYFAVLQVAFALTWTVYVIFLPALAAQAGIDRAYVPWILMLDQLVFAVCDWAAGVMADRVGRAMGRLGNLVGLVTLGSCAAFLALPFVAPMASPAIFLAITIVWSITSSALRAPPLVLVGRYAAVPEQGFFAAFYLFGLGVAGAVAPYLTVTLKGVDPRLPFALASVALAIVALSLARMERSMSAREVQRQRPVAGERKPGRAPFIAAVLLLALGFQIHFSMNTAPAYLRFARPEDLPLLMPVFAIGFNLAVLPAALLTKRWDGLTVMAGSALAGAVAVGVASFPPSLDALVIAQLFAGAAWGTALTAALVAALTIGRTGHEGAVTGAMFSMLAIAAAARIAMVIALTQGGRSAPILHAAPPVAWVLSSLALAALAWMVRRKS